jgi:hypothetical protein
MIDAKSVVDFAGHSSAARFAEITVHVACADGRREAHHLAPALRQGKDAFLAPKSDSIEGAVVVVPSRLAR